MIFENLSDLISLNIVREIVNLISYLNSNLNKYITFLFYNTKISDDNAESGKVPRMLAAFPR
jgi:hypothetical protein